MNPKFYPVVFYWANPTCYYPSYYFYYFFWAFPDRSLPYYGSGAA